VYGADVNDRAKGTSGNSVENTIFADFAMIGNEGVKRTYTRCVFAGDVKWYWFSGATATSGYEELVLTGATSDERRASLLALLTEKGLRIEDVASELQQRHDPNWDKQRREAKAKGEMK
jgi:hypothetical protein